MKRLWLFSAIMLMCAAAGYAQEEQNGLQIEVTRKTTSRNDVRTDAYFDRSINRTMGLHVVVKNVSMKPFPEGEIDYSLLVLKVDYSPVYYELYTGTEKLPALQIGDSADIVIGDAQINGYANPSEQRKDKLDYQLIIKHNGAETARVSSMDDFDTVAENAHKMNSRKKKNQ
jgi:hypothetical protein